MSEAISTEEKSPQVKAVVSFGGKTARKGPVPKGLKLSYQILMIASMIWAIVVEPIFTNIPPNMAHKVDQFLIAFNTFYYQLCQQFGWVPTKGSEEEQTTEV